jgi:alkylhydroperoxidase family enzyme
MADALAKGNLASAEVSDLDRTMLEYVEKLTRRPATVSEADIIRLHEAGFGDAAIGDIAIHAAHFAFMNRIVDGLRAEVPSAMIVEARRAGIQSPVGTAR